jgi:hypothetical protein
MPVDHVVDTRSARVEKCDVRRLAKTSYYISLHKVTRSEFGRCRVQTQDQTGNANQLSYHIEKSRRLITEIRSGVRSCLTKTTHM